MDLMQRYPAVSYLAARARRRIPHVAWEFLESGTGSDACVARNAASFEAVELVPQFLKGKLKPAIATRLFDFEYAAPFGIAPIGQSGFIWPGAEAILAATAAEFRLPYCLSTVASRSIEEIGPLARGMGWFQLYTPRDEGVTDDLLARAERAGFSTLLVTADVPVPSRRERQFRAGLTLPPSFSAQIAAQVAMRPRWCLEILRRGFPRFRSLEPYLDRMQGGPGEGGGVSEFMRRHMGGALDWEVLARIRDRWRGPLVLKGVLDVADAERAVGLGLNGVLVSNHGGRQLDAAPAALAVLPEIVAAVGDRAKVLVDSGARTGGDVVKALALGADFVLLGRAFQYGVAALGPRGGDHVATIIVDEMKNTMAQLGVETLDALGMGLVRGA